MKHTLFFIILLLSFQYLLPTESSALMIGLSTERLTKESEAVITGEVKDVECRWSEDGKTIFSRASIAIKTVIKGAIAQDEVFVEYPGGEIDGIGFRVSDIAPLKKGEEVLLFLKAINGKKDTRDTHVELGVHRIVGRAQGKYLIGEDGIARKNGFSLIGGDNVIDNYIPIKKLLDKIRGVK